MGDSNKGQQKTQHRLKAIMRGAFAGPPTPLKDIPTKAGESRAERPKPKKTKKPAKQAS